MAGPSPFERAAEIAPTHPNAALMQRMQDSSFREVWRLSNLLLKIKGQVRGRELGKEDPESGNAPDKLAPIVGACPEQSEGGGTGSDSRVLSIQQLEFRPGEREKGW